MSIPEARKRLQTHRMNELAVRHHEGDISVMDELTRLGYPLVQMLVYRRGYFLRRWGDNSDLLQEGMVGYLEAIDSWRPASNDNFYRWAMLCIRRQLIQTLKVSNRTKHQILSKSRSYDEPMRGRDDRGASDEMVSTLLDVWSLDNLPTDEPAEAALKAEDGQELRTLVDMLLAKVSPLERESILRVWGDGQRYKVVAEAIGSHAKAVDNAISRARRKAQSRAQVLLASSKIPPHLREELRKWVVGG